MVLEAEPDAALGNGGLGRLAACFLDSMASLGIAGFGYGIRYEHGLFRQGLDDGWQAEQPENWLVFGNPWEFERPEVAYPIRFFGTVRETDGAGPEPQAPVGGRPARAGGGLRYAGRRLGRPAHQHAAPVVGAEPEPDRPRIRSTAATTCRPSPSRSRPQSISRVLYPNDATEAGQELRLKQEYFFTSASLQDILRRHLSCHPSSTACPTRRRSSSTTPIRRWPCPS